MRFFQKQTDEPTLATLNTLVHRLMANPEIARAGLASRLRRLACEADKPIRARRDADDKRQKREMMG